MSEGRTLVDKLVAYYDYYISDGVSEEEYEHEYDYDDNYDPDLRALAELVHEGKTKKEVGEIEGDREALLLRLEKSVISQAKAGLEADPKANRNFSDKTGWKVLDQLLAVVRLKELTQVRITQRGGRGKGLRFDVTELAATYFGKKILSGLDMQRRRSLNRDELDQVRAACAKLKLTLPEVVDPTTTEKFFATDDG